MHFSSSKRNNTSGSLVYLQSGWEILSAKEVRTRRKKMTTLKLSNLGVNVIVHRNFPLEEVKRVAAKLTPLGRVYIAFVVDHEYPRLQKTGKVVGVDVGVGKLLTTSDGEYEPDTRPHEKAFNKTSELHKALSRKKFLSLN
ncbi:hypothetical protein HS1genome_2042 [Sulfodiicoccus acidiphilus]|uniref:Uncharacterized protein n=1 Tax=Sulfodiicoccus acidiphilus TaxID=1670455 RepID=A0A348B651_9CREN|nr:hypothetical protein HS1genome_2042 [Sulfodiicoccus acidiphilus]GGU02030.1 hypothetical protein GCM10007116_18930 [Sulfodiicoccus acidiphilus]